MTDRAPDTRKSNAPLAFDAPEPVASGRQRKEDAVWEAENELRDFVENAIVALHWVGPDGRILWANRAELDLLGYEKEEYIGRHIADFYADPADASAVLARLRGNEELHDHEARLRAKNGRIRHVLISSNVYWRDGKFVHTRCFTHDITSRKIAEQALAAQADRTLRLTRITAAIADAVTAEQVFEAVVDQVGEVLESSTSALWLVIEGDSVARLARSIGYPEASKRMLTSVPLEGAPSFPALDAMKRGEPVWIASQEELIQLYPHLAGVTTPGRDYSIACLPIVAQSTVLGALGFTFDDRRPLDEAEKNFLLVVARYSGQALERLRLLRAEQESRLRAELLYGLAGDVISAERVEDIFEAALDAIEYALGTKRASILLFDSKGVMRFKAWRNLSEAYRRAVEGHSPWTRETRDPQPIVSKDVETDPAVASYLPLFRSEGIGALAFIPLVADGRLIGKFMVYYERPRELASSELHVARAIADHVATAVTRFNSMTELEEIVRFNELFTGILGHDLRNPLAAIITAARLLLAKDESSKLLKPLSRILTSGDRMTRMIDQLLDFTRVRMGGGIPLSPSEFDLLPILRHVIDELDDANPDWTLRLASAGDTTGKWDADRLSQVFSNLVANAVQHGIPSGGVGVTVEGREREAVRVEVHNLGTIPPELIPKLFEPLAGGRGRSENSRGLGLGLHITQELIKAHGGHIHVSSNESHGTTFTVVLPREL